MKRLLALLLAFILLVPSALAEVPDISALGKEDLLALYESTAARLKELGYYPYVELKSGDTGAEVTALQERLSELNYLTKTATGKYDKNTVSAMKSFEKTSGLKRDGIASTSDQQLIFGSQAIARPIPASKLAKEPTPAPSPTSAPTPSPVPTPVSDESAFLVTKVNLYESYNYNKFKIEAKNASPSYTIDAFDVIVRAYNRYGDQLGWYSSTLERTPGFTVQDCNVQPGKAYSSGSQYWDLSGYNNAVKIDVAVTRYHTSDGKTIVIQDSDLTWVSGEK